MDPTEVAAINEMIRKADAAGDAQALKEASDAFDKAMANLVHSDGVAHV
jgi:DNA-binding GntR family transcriptional regulator